MVDDMCCSPAKITVFRHFVAFAITQLQDRGARCVGSSAKLGGVCLDDRGPVRVNSLSGKDSHAEYLEDCFTGRCRRYLFSTSPLESAFSEPLF